MSKEIQKYEPMIIITIQENFESHPRYKFALASEKEGLLKQINNREIRLIDLGDEAIPPAWIKSVADHDGVVPDPRVRDDLNKAIANYKYTNKCFPSESVINRMTERLTKQIV